MRKIILHIICLLIIMLAVNTGNAQTKPGYQLPKYETFKLPNGLTVYLMEKHEVPVISINVIIPAGAIYDGNKAGLASLTSSCLQGGTKSFTKQQIEEEFDFAGASVSINSSTEFARLSAKIAVKDEEKLLPMVKELLLSPTFPADEFDKEKKRELIGLDQSKESPGQVINAYWNKFYYGSYAYGNVVNGTVSSLSTLTAGDAATFYKTYYNPDGSAIAVTGDFSTKDMKATLTKLFSGWKKTASVANPSAQAFTPSSDKKILLVNKDDAKETTMIIGSAGITRNNPDYVAIQVVNTIFGGRFTSWINEELRVKSGLTYGAGSYFDMYKNNGAFLISTHTANATTEPTITKALEVVNRLQNDSIDAETLTSAKNYMIGLFPPRYQTTDQLAGLLTGMFWYGYNESYINNFEANVNAVTAAKAKEVVQKYFPKNKIQFVLIGKSSEIKSIAAKYGSVEEVQIKDDIGKGF